MSIAKVPAAPRHGSMLSSLKAQYRKLRTFKGTVRALINLKRSPLLSVVKVTSPTKYPGFQLPRLLASSLKFESLWLTGQLGKAREPPTTSPYDCTYASLWNCALQNGEKKLKFDDYEAYMLCLHRLILPEFNITASKELIRDDWKRDSGEQDFLDYSFFHLSMFELVDVSNVDILEKSKGVTMEVIEQDLQLELSSEAFKFYRDQIKLATKAAHNVEQGPNERTSLRRQSRSKQRGNDSLVRTQSRRSSELSSPRHSQPGGSRRSSRSQSRGAIELNILRPQSRSQQGDNESSPRSQSRERKLSSSRREEPDGSIKNGSESIKMEPLSQSYPAGTIPRKQTGLQRGTSPNIFSRGGGVVLNIGMMDADSPREPSQSSGLHVSHIEALGSTLRTGTQDPNALGLSLNPGAADFGTIREPFTVRTAAVAEAAANMAVPASPSNSGQPFSAQHTLLQLQQHIPQSDANGPYINNSSLTAPLITIISSKAPTPINKINLQLHEMQATRPQTPHEGRLGTPISSPRASNAITAQAIGIFISSQQQPKPPTSTRPINLGTILSSDHHPPKVSKALQQFQQDESPSLVAVVPGLVPATIVPLTISGKPAAPNIRVESAHQQPSKEKAPVLLEDGSITRKFNGVTRTSPPKDDSKSLLSPRYVVAEPAVSHRSTPISTLKQASIQPHGSIRGFTGIKNSPRIRQQPSRLVTDPATSYLQQHRQQRHLSEPQELVQARIALFRRFIARFGPLEFSLSKLVACFCINRELVPWFHGEIGRDEAESVLSTRERSDGAFLVRFSESHPTKFTLTYLKIHSASSNTPGRRELKNCLVNNLGATGYALTEAVRRGGARASVRQRTYPSIGAFIQSSSARLKYGVASEFSSKCNQELAAVRAIQDQQSDSYAAFSAESFGNPEPPANATFSRTPPSQSSFLNTPMFNMNAGNASGGISDSYASFTLDSLAPPTVHRVEDPPSTCHYEDSDGKGSSASRPFVSDYGSFAAFAQQRQPQEQAQPSTAQRTPAVSDEYASFANLASTYSHDSQQAAIRQATAFSRSPSSTIQSGFANTGAYGSFASVAVSKPTTADAPNSRKHSATDDYGSFASLADEFEDKRPQWEQSLGPPPPPMTAPASADVYGDFAALSLSNKVSTHKEQAPPPKSLPIAPNADVYGSFDPTASTPATTITPTTSALDELNVGMEFYKQKRLDDALLRFMLAQEMARSTGDQVVEARALGNLGTVYLDKKNPHQAVRCYQHCLDITRAIEDTKRERTILNNLVLALVASEDLERALSCCQVQLETTTNAMNRRKIISRMSLLREKMARQATS
ncbi:uncharacterized protein PITG_02464 [Phytophthora infestans T30-4]|uniref:SH2 domain-containing protein n=1 Tax=Phytophthora infestans (strain T30-4) TaxID=403677 RepID=D0MWE0_PHYIT|nr:uncharacterized protein PITG_02464 [Phytophthora infestans T30-4]EEY63953.1 conserved hypothetical protein [Phytophthora infestans T30-4]|eukprot:XP_002907389.1 conserved hypothetical protein [Phytophthora infestans T30-4]